MCCALVLLLDIYMYNGRVSNEWKLIWYDITDYNTVNIFQSL